jgi:hypothetical protein
MSVLALVRGTGCIATERLFRPGPIRAYPGARQTPAGYAKTEWDNQWVYGIVHPAVKSLTLVNMDCSTRELPLDEDGVFNYVAGRKQIEKGELQWKLIGRGAGGEVLAEREVSIGLTRNAKNAEHPVPVPRQNCRLAGRVGLAVVLVVPAPPLVRRPLRVSVG